MILTVTGLDVTSFVYPDTVIGVVFTLALFVGVLTVSDGATVSTFIEIDELLVLPSLSDT